MNDVQMRDLARRGAEIRYYEALEEIRAIKNLIRDPGFDTGMISFPPGSLKTPPRKKTSRRRKPWSKAARQAASQRMKKYWAGQRALKNKKK